MTAPAVTALALTIAERQVEAARLRKEGYAYREIAAILDISIPTAMNDVKHALEMSEFTLAELGTEIREMVMSRDNDAIKAIYEKVLSGDLMAIDRLIRINEQLLNMVGGQITRHDITSGGKAISTPITVVEVILADETNRGPVILSPEET